MNTERILVRGVNWLGDAVMTMPALVRLREARPAARIVILTPQKLADLWRHHPAVDQVEVVKPGESLWCVAGRLRRFQFQTAIVLPNSIRSSLEVWLAAIPERIGYAAPGRQWFLSRSLPTRLADRVMRKRSAGEIRKLIRTANLMEQKRGFTAFHYRGHHLHRYLHLVAAAVGAKADPVAPEIVISQEEVGKVRRELGLETSSERKAVFCGINAGAEYGPAKRWPLERFAAAAIEVQNRAGCRWVLFGGPADRELVGDLRSRMERGLAGTGQGPIDLAGKTSLRQLTAALKSCRLLLTNDTGPMHLAAAVGTPVVVPFGSTSAQLSGPGLPGDSRNRLLSSTAPCSPCFLRECPIDFRCMRGIHVEAVIQAVCEVLARSQ